MIPTLDQIKKSRNKLFIGGLYAYATEQDLFTYFKQFGEVTYVDRILDKETRNSRGFGFVAFKNAESVLKVFQQDQVKNPHKIRNKTIDPKLAEPVTLSKKIFVGGLKTKTTEEYLMGYFGAYGVIDRIERPFDKVRNQPKSYCFIRFEDNLAVFNILQERYHWLDGKKCQIKEAVDDYIPPSKTPISTSSQLQSCPMHNNNLNSSLPITTPPITYSSVVSNPHLVTIQDCPIVNNPEIVIPSTIPTTVQQMMLSDCPFRLKQEIVNSALDYYVKIGGSVPVDYNLFMLIYQMVVNGTLPDSASVSLDQIRLNNEMEGLKLGEEVISQVQESL